MTDQTPKRNNWLVPALTLMYEQMQAVANHNEWRVITFVFARTAYWGREWAGIPARHFIEGVFRNRDQELVQPGCGLSKSPLWRAIASLVEKQMLLKNTGVGTEWTQYSLNYDWSLHRYLEENKDIVSPYRDRVVPLGGRYSPVGGTTKELTIETNKKQGCAAAHTQELETGDTSMPAIPAKEALQSLLHNVTESTRRNRKERAKKMTATGYMAAWQDSFMAHYPEEKWFPWRTYEMSAFKKAISKIDEDQRELFVDFVIRDFEPTIMEQFSWMKAKPVVPHVGFVTKHIEIFYRAYRDYLDPNRTVKAKIKSSKPRIKPAPVANKKQDEEVARLKEENAKLRSENQKHRVRKVIVKRQRAQSIIRTRSVNPEFGKWSD